MNENGQTVETIAIDVDVNVNATPEADLITMTQASKLIRGKSGGFINLQVLQRYARRGRMFTIGDQQKRLVLPTTMRGCTRYTSAAVVAAFNLKYGELAMAESMTPDPPRIQSASKQRKELERTAKRLRKMGYRQPEG